MKCRAGTVIPCCTEHMEFEAQNGVGWMCSAGRQGRGFGFFHCRIQLQFQTTPFILILLYIIIAIVTVGSLPFSEIKEAKDYVLAEAAKPMLGQVGFTIITIAALISTFSAINASILGGTRVSYEIAEDDELPHHLTGKLWNQPIGLLITSVLTLIVANILKLESPFLT